MAVAEYPLGNGSAYNYASSNEKLISWAAAFGTHLLFIALIVFGVNWHHQTEPQANIVDLWSNLPSQPTVAPPPPPPPPPAPRIEPKAPAVKTPVKDEPPPISKADIALKDKAEKDRKARDDKQKEIDKQKDAQKREQEALAAKQQAADAQRVKDQQEAAQKLAAQRAATDKLVNEYTDRIKAQIKRYIVIPANMQGNPQAEFEVVLLVGGNVLSAKLTHSSGNTAYDTAVERAILKAQPLPLPPDPALFANFRELNLKFRPQE